MTPLPIRTVIIALVASLLALGTVRADDGVPRMSEDLLLAYVKSVLAANPAVKAREIDIATSCGVVQLNGFVGSMEARRIAAGIAARMLGVRAVHNNLVVESTDTTGETVGMSKAAG
jgi:hypothetical protein